MQAARRGPGRPLRWMAAQDRIRLTGLLREEPPQGGSSYRAGYPARPSHSPNCGFARRTGSARDPCRRACEHVFALIVCVLIPRFELAVAAGGREVLAAGPVALAPEAGREQFIGEVSAAAEAHGVRAGLRLGEALARCPTLRLVDARPGRRGRRVGSPAGRARERRRGGRARPSRPRVVRRARPAQPARRLRRGGDRGGAARARHPGAPGSGAVALRRPGGGQPGPRPPRGAGPREAAGRLPGAAAGRPARHPAGDRRAARDPRALRDPHARRARRPAASRPGRPLRRRRPAGQGPRAREGLPAQAPPPRREPGGAARAAGVGLRPAARARARPADRPAARPPRASRSLAALRRPWAPSWSRAGAGARA